MNTNQDEHIDWILHAIMLIRNALNQSTSLTPEQKAEILRLTYRISDIINQNR